MTSAMAEETTILPLEVKSFYVKTRFFINQIATVANKGVKNIIGELKSRM